MKLRFKLAYAGVFALLSAIITAPTWAQNIANSPASSIAAAKPDGTGLSVSSGTLKLGGTGLQWNGSQIGLGPGAASYDITVHKTAASAASEIAAWSDGNAGRAQLYSIANAGSNYGTLAAYDPGAGSTTLGQSNASNVFLVAVASSAFGIGTTNSASLVLGAGGGVSITINSSQNVTLKDGATIGVGTTTGTQIGTSASQKIGFFAATPVVQQNTTGTATGFTAGAGTTVTDQSTFTGGVGSTAYRISDVVRAMKQYGLLAQ